MVTLFSKPKIRIQRLTKDSSHFWELDLDCRVADLRTTRWATQKVPENIRNQLPIILRVIGSPAANHNLFSIWSPALYSGIVSLFSKFTWFSKISSKTGDSDPHLLILSTILESVCEAHSFARGKNHLLDATAFLDSWWIHHLWGPPSCECLSKIPWTPTSSSSWCSVFIVLPLDIAFCPHLELC